MLPSSRGLGHRPFTAVTGVRIPLGVPQLSPDYLNPRVRYLNLALVETQLSSDDLNLRVLLNTLALVIE